MQRSTDDSVSNVDRVDIADLCFTARALAQTHPMAEAAHRYRQMRFEQERRHQPATEIADWASTALLVGYCLRRAEEQAIGRVQHSAEAGAGMDFAAGAAEVAEQLRAGDAASVTLLPAASTVAALDRIIASELKKRSEHVREQLDDEAWSELEDYIAWWVVHGYGVRAAEQPNR